MHQPVTNKFSDDQLHTRQPKLRVLTLEHLPPPTADAHIYICMLANSMHVWLAKQQLINKGLRQWLPSGVRSASQRFSLSLPLPHALPLSVCLSNVCLSASLSVCPYAFLPDTENGVKPTGISQDPGPGRRPTCRFEFQFIRQPCKSLPCSVSPLSLSLSPSLVCLSARLSVCRSVHLPFFPTRRME